MNSCAVIFSTIDANDICFKIRHMCLHLGLLLT